MARDSLTTILISKVSGVYEVKAPIHTVLSDTPTDFIEVLRVSTWQCKTSVVAANCEIYTSNSRAKTKGYLSQSPWILGCTRVTRDTREKFKADTESAKSLRGRKRIQQTNWPGYPAETLLPEITGRKHKL